MSNDSKQFPPSEEKLKSLREKGEIVKTRDFISVAIIASLTLVFFQILKNGVFSTQLLENNLDITVAEPDKLKSNLLYLFAITVKVLLTVLSFVLFLNLLQTQFFFKPNLAKFDFSRNLNIGNYLEGFSSRIKDYLVQVLRLLLFLCFSYFILNLTLTGLESFFSNYSSLKLANDLQLKSAIDLMLSQPKTVLLYLLIMFMGLGVTSYFFNFIKFRVAHSMTRGEIESEGKEQEMSSLLKRNIRD